ncbi:twin-arginine translocase subunit TatC [Halomarina salina]|uniref:Sec-independent protein translocase protein TatC n=1 Tax=Halomarina salina TaxID=1872699 RepID=A0ABD5RM72_9EURY|nr:twin-arginine translocase subunit TatC [Halomarina salina]
MTGDERRNPDDEVSGSQGSPEGSPETGDDAGDADAADAPEDRTDLDALTYKELQSLAADHGIAPVGHGKDDLRELIADARGSDGAVSDDGVDADSESVDTDVDEGADSDADEGDDGRLNEIPTVDPDDPAAGSGWANDESTDSDATADAADTAAGETDDSDVDGDDSTEDDGSIPDWARSDEPATEDIVGPTQDDDDLPEAPDRPDPNEELAHDAPFEAVEGDSEDDLAQSDGGATVVDGDKPEVDYDYYDDGGFADGPEADQEMPLADHIEEMVKRLGIVILSMALVSVLVLPFAVDLINFIWYSILGSVQNSVTSPRAYQPLSLVLARLKVATLAGFVIALPVFVYETYLFMRPGLYKHERRYYLAAVPTSLVLAFIGVAFAFYLVLPFIFSYFVSYSEQAADIAFGLTETFGLMLLLMGFFAAVFQIPLLIMLAVMMGLTTREWLAQRRLYFWGGFLGVALLFSPDPTGMAPFIVAITMVILFEGTLLLLRWTQR